jgi:hypothetical protein
MADVSWRPSKYIHGTTGTFNIVRPQPAHTPGEPPIQEGFYGPAGQEPYVPPTKKPTLGTIKKLSPTIETTTVPDYNIAPPVGMNPLEQYMQQVNWQALVNSNRPAMDKLWQRWAGKTLSEENLTTMLLGREGSLDLYKTYERFREYEVWRPSFMNYYGYEPNAEQVQRVIDKFGTPESFSNFQAFHKQADTIWQNSILARQISAEEINELLAGRTPAFPGVETYMEV